MHTILSASASNYAEYWLHASALCMHGLLGLGIKQDKLKLSTLIKQLFEDYSRLPSKLN